MVDDFNFDPFDDDNGRTRPRVGGIVRDVIRKTVSQGAEARHLTEETLRNIVGDIKLPREIVTLVVQQADQVKSEVVRVVAGEVRTFLDEANIGEEIAKILTTLSFEIRTEIRFIPNDEKLRPAVKSKVGLKSQRGGGTTEYLDDEESRVLEGVIRRGLSNVLSSRFLNRVLGPDDAEGEDDSSTDESEEATQARAPATVAKKASGTRTRTTSRTTPTRPKKSST